MTTQELIELKESLTARADQSSKQLVEACAPHKVQFGLVSDEYRQSDEYASLNGLYQFDKQQLAAFWKMVRGNKEFAKANKAHVLSKRYTNR